MARRIHLASHLTTEELEQRYRRAKDPRGRGRWQVLWLLARGYTATALAEVTGYSAYWIGPFARRSNQDGPAVVERPRPARRNQGLLLSDDQLEDLRQALQQPAPDGDEWNGRTVAEWLSRRLDRPVSRWLGWSYLRRLDGRPLAPRPRHAQADPAAHEAFKKGSATPSAR